jgi:hypothetical protein
MRTIMLRGSAVRKRNDVASARGVGWRRGPLREPGAGRRECYRLFLAYAPEIREDHAGTLSRQRHVGCAWKRQGRSRTAPRQPPQPPWAGLLLRRSGPWQGLQYKVGLRRIKQPAEHVEPPASCRWAAQSAHDPGQP